MEYNKETTRIGTLFYIKNKGGIDFAFQNFVTTPYSWRGKTYQYAPIEYIPAARTIDLDVTQASAIVPNIPPISDYMEAYKGFKDCVVQAFIIFPDNANATPVAHDPLVIASSRISGAEIEFSLENPFGVASKFPSIYFTTGLDPSPRRVGYVPEVPYTGSVDVY